MVSIAMNIDTRAVEKMLKKYPDRARREYRTAMVKTTAKATQEYFRNSPVVSGDLQKAWLLNWKGDLFVSMYNNMKYASKVNYVQRKQGVPFQSPNKNSKAVKSGLAVFSKRITRSKKDGYLYMEKSNKVITPYFNKQMRLANERIFA